MNQISQWADEAEQILAHLKSVCAVGSELWNYQKGYATALRKAADLLETGQATSHIAGPPSDYQPLG